MDRENNLQPSQEECSYKTCQYQLEKIRYLILIFVAMSVNCIDNNPIPFDTQANCESCFNTEYCTLVETGDTTQVQFRLTPVTGVNVLPEGNFEPQSEGTTDGTTANKLVDSTATFATDGVIVGAMVKNTTDNTYANVTAVDSETQITLDADIFISGEDYIIINWELGIGTIGTNVTFDGSSVTLKSAECSIVMSNVLEAGRYYRIKLTGTRDSGTQKLTLNNNSLVDYLQFGNFDNTETVVFVKAVATDKLRISGFAPFTGTQITILDIEVVEMSSLYYLFTDCDNPAVLYEESATVGVSYNLDIPYRDNPDAIFYGMLTFDWDSGDFDRLPNPGCFCLCVKDYALSFYDFVANGDFDVNSFDQATYWDITNSLSAGWGYSAGFMGHVSEVGAGVDELSQTLLAPLDSTLCYTLSIGYDSDNGFSIDVKYDTATLTGQTLASLTKALGAGTETIDITNIGITRIYFEVDNDEQLRISDISILLDADCWDCACQSTCISLSSDHANTRLSMGCLFELTATNTNNAFGFNFEDFTFTPGMRLFGKLRNGSYQDDTEYYTKSDGEKILVYADIEKVEELQIAEVPEGIHDWLHAAMLLDSFMIDGVEYVRVGEYAPNWRKSSAKAPVIVQVAKKTQNRYNTYS
jgi:hypothetical protein